MLRCWALVFPHYQLPITNYQLPITNYPLPIAHYQITSLGDTENFCVSPCLLYQVFLVKLWVMMLLLSFLLLHSHTPNLTTVAKLQYLWFRLLHHPRF
ncbi:hypothetical protein CBP10_15315 [Fischerella thermalis WC558]|nr:hypothetical protein CBP10_15315 [Fischerella thermalis WC558]